MPDDPQIPGYAKLEQIAVTGEGRYLSAFALDAAGYVYQYTGAAQRDGVSGTWLLVPGGVWKRLGVGRLL